MSRNAWKNENTYRRLCMYFNKNEIKCIMEYHTDTIHQLHIQTIKKAVLIKYIKNTYK